MTGLIVFDPLFFAIVGPVMLVALWAQWRVKGTFAKYRAMPLRSGVSGAEAAAHILRAAGIGGVRIEEVPGMLSDHYDPRSRVVRLSGEVLRGRNAAAVAVAAHEVGHAIQHAQAYRPMEWRAGLVPVVNFTSQLALPMLLFGLFLGIAQVAWMGVVMFAAALLFHLVTLPVEFDASRRAIRILEGSGLAAGPEMTAVRKTLYAAGFTYVAATAVAAANLLYWLLQSGLLGGRDQD